MRTVIHLTLLIALLFVSGCESTVCMQSKRNLQRFEGGDRPVFVTNPELRREYAILHASEVYPLASQPNGARRLTLHPMQQYGRCANPLMFSALTVGIIPGFLPGARLFNYDLETDGVTNACTHYLPVYERISIWEWLVRRDEDTVFAEALGWSAREQRPDIASRQTAARDSH